MVKKVALDTLELEEDDVLLRSEGPPLEAGKEEKLVFFPRFPRKWLAVASLAPVLLALATVALYRGVQVKGNVPPAIQKGSPAAASLPAALPLARVNDFVIPLKDEGGYGRLLLCDLTLELYAGGETDFSPDNVETRRIVYEIFNKKAVSFLTDPETKSSLKEEIIAALSNALGQDVIRTVYFTKYLVL